MSEVVKNATRPTVGPKAGADWVFGLVALDESPNFEAVYDPNVRWNGWLCPYLDRAAVDEVIEFIHEESVDDGTFYWDGDVLVHTISWEDGDDIQRIEPLWVGGCLRWTPGAFSWVWRRSE